MNNAVRLIIFAIVVAGLAVLAFFKLRSNQKEVEANIYKKDPNATTLIQAEQLQPAPFEYRNTYLGSFSPNKEAIIASESSGRVIRTNIEEGTYVTAGSVIAQLDTDILTNQLKSAEANLALAEKTASRLQAAAVGVTEVQIDNANTQAVNLKYQIELLKKQISMTTIKAPFSGIITGKYFETGSLAGPGAQMATIIDISQLKLEINVPEKEITQFTKGMKLNVKTEIYPDVSFPGTVWLIASKADASRNYTVKITVPNNGKHPLKAGMYGTVELTGNDSKESISIPRTALIGSNKNPEVYIVKDGIVQRQAITLGASNETRLQVLSGLNAGDVIATGGLVNLTDGTKVTIAQN